MGSVAQIIYGYGHHLGNFEIFARSLARTLIPTFGRDKVLIENIVRRDDFFEYLTNPPFKPTHRIAELHIFSHSIGGGVFIAYGDTATDHMRAAAFERARLAGRRVTYDEVLAAEAGAILTDDFLRGPYLRKRGSIRNNFESSATLKLWGCNSGVPGWVYRDGNNVTDPADTSASYYWRALNERNAPKPAVAQAFADYFGHVCYGASSGSHVEVLHHHRWETTTQYRTASGHWPSGALTHRLQPDRGNYDAFVPAGP